jgi:hypothetical protein
MQNIRATTCIPDERSAGVAKRRRKFQSPPAGLNRGRDKAVRLLSEIESQRRGHCRTVARREF